MSFITKLIMKIQHVRYGHNFKVNGIPIIVNRGRIIIGNNVTIKSSILSNLVGIYQKTMITSRTKDSIIKIGDNVGLSGATIYARNKIEIGDNTLIGANTKILDNDFHPLDINDRNNDIKEKIKSKPIFIGKNCFIGCNVIILKGTILGDGCIVGAGAVVSGKFEPNSVIVGNPGKVLKNKQ